MTLPAWWPSDKPYIISDVLVGLKQLPEGVVQCVVTSPPYWGLRDYGTAKWEGGDPKCDHKNGRFERGGLSTIQASNIGSGGDEARENCKKCGAKRIDAQLGLEATPEEYVANLVEVFREVRRVLRDNGTLFLNLGDTYNGSGGAGGDYAKGGLKEGQPTYPGRDCATLKPKDLVGIPWRVAFALQADGWYLRSDIIWHKPNPMPESCTDRPTKSHEYIFLLTKNARYFYDHEAIKEHANYDGRKDTTMKWSKKFADASYLPSNNGQTFHERGHERWQRGANGEYLRNKRSVWTITTKPFKGAHFATFPPELPMLCIKAGTSEKGACPDCGSPWERVVEHQNAVLELSTTAKMKREMGLATQTGGKQVSPATTKTLGWKPTCECNGKNNHQITPCIVLDPFAGSGTVLEVCRHSNRQGLGIELNHDYEPLIRERSMANIPKLTQYLKEGKK